MEEEISYSTVVFKNGDQPPAPKESAEDPVIYSEVKPKGAAAAPNGEAAAQPHFPALVACSGILCVLVLAMIGAVVYISVVMNRQEVNLSDLTAENQQLMTERSILKREAEELSRVTGNLNWTLRFILKFNIFPVSDFCPDKQCRPCQQGWTLFQEKCYLFYNQDAPWKTWEESQKLCRGTAADLVVIDSLREQEFISDHIKSYYTRAHGYWMGLYETQDRKWVWLDGRKDTLEYWIAEPLGDSGPCALMIPERDHTANWDPANCIMRNKFICESDVLIRSN